MPLSMKIECYILDRPKPTGGCAAQRFVVRNGPSGLPLALGGTQLLVEMLLQLLLVEVVLFLADLLVNLAPFCSSLRTLEVSLLLALLKS